MERVGNTSGGDGAEGQKWHNRRAVLRSLGGLAVTGAGVAGSTGTGTAHHVEDIDLEPADATMTVGEPSTFTVHWVSGHGSEACFVFSVRVDGEWIEIGREEQSALDTGEHVHLDSEVTVPDDVGTGTYTLRVSASEAYHRCPHPGERDFPILAADAEIDVEERKSRPNDVHVDTATVSLESSELVVGERGAKQWTVDDTAVLYHEYFAIETADDDLLPSYDEERVTVLDEFSAGGTGTRTGRLEFDWDGGSTFRVEREVTPADEGDRFDVEYRIENRAGEVDDVTLYQYADFDVVNPADDVATYHPDRGQGLVTVGTEATAEAPVCGFAAAAELDDHALGPYQTDYDVDGDHLSPVEQYPDDGTADVVGVQQWDLGTLNGPSRSTPPSYDSESRTVRFGAADDVTAVEQLLDLNVWIDISEPRLGQATEDGRLIDPTRNDPVIESLDSVPLIQGKRTVPIFELDVDNADVLPDGAEVAFTFDLAASATDSPLVSETFTVDKSTLQNDVDDLAFLEGTAPAVDLPPDAERLRLGVDDPKVSALDHSSSIGSDVRKLDTLELGFVAVRYDHQQNGNTVTEDVGQSRYEDQVERAVEYIDRNFPVPEVLAYRHDDRIDSNGSEGPSGDTSDRCEDMPDGYEAQQLLFEEVDDNGGVQDNVRGVNGTITDLDATIAIVPDGYFDHYTGDSWCGLHYGNHELAAFVDIDCAERTTAHELGHHFLPDDYFGPPTDLDYGQRDDNGSYTGPNGEPIDADHTRHPNSSNYGDQNNQQYNPDEPGVVSRSVEIANGTLDRTRPDADPMMSYGSDEWISTLTYNSFVDTELDPHPDEDVDLGESLVEVVTGLFCDGDGDAEPIRHLGSGLGHPMTSDEDGTAEVAVLDADGDVLHSYATDDRIVGVGQEGGSRHGSRSIEGAFTFSLPLSEDATTVRVTRDDEVFHRSVRAGSLTTAIEQLPDRAFDGKPDDRRRALLNKLRAVESQFDAGAYDGAARKLDRDVRKSIDRWILGDFERAANHRSKTDLLALLEEAIAHAENAGGGRGKGTTDSDNSDRGNGSDDGNRNDDAGGGPDE